VWIGEFTIGGAIDRRNGFDRGFLVSVEVYHVYGIQQNQGFP